MKKKLVLEVLVSLFVVLTILRIYTTPGKREFFGIQILNLEEPHIAFSKVVWRKAIWRKHRKINYAYREGMANPNIYCWGEIDRGTIILEIVNKSKEPIELNYSSDDYQLKTEDGTRHKLKIYDDIADYPDSIKPGKKAKIRLTGFEGRSEDIKIIGAGLSSGKVIILLRRIETESS